MVVVWEAAGFDYIGFEGMEDALRPKRPLAQNTESGRNAPRTGHSTLNGHE
jgi:hypothetical protein